MATYSWPTRDQAAVVGKPIDRIDGIAKATGTAKYSYDINLKNQLIAHGFGCPHAHCKIKSIDVSEARKVSPPDNVRTERRRSACQWSCTTNSCSSQKRL